MPASSASQASASRQSWITAASLLLQASGHQPDGRRDHARPRRLDTTAVAIAATLGADLCQIYTDVDGVYTADPRIVKDAKKLDAITYDEMLELASLGAQVLHNRSVEMAKKYNVDLEVVSSFTRNPGTKVKEGSNMEKLNVSGVARDNNCARVAIINLDDTPGTAFKVFSLMAKHHVNIDIILQSVGRDNKKSISFTIRQDDAERVESILRDAKEMLGYEDPSINTKVAKVSIVGAGMASATGVASKMFEALAMAGINIRMISTSEIKISVLINEEDSEKAVKAIHEEFFNALIGAIPHDCIGGVWRKFCALILLRSLAIHKVLLRNRAASARKIYSPTAHR